MTVVNESPVDAEIQYSINGGEQKQEFPKGSAGGFDVTVQSTAVPPAIEFKAYEKGTLNALKMNDEDTLSIVPVEIKSPVVVKLSNQGGS